MTIPEQIHDVEQSIAIREVERDQTEREIGLLLYQLTLLKIKVVVREVVVRPLNGN